MKNPFNLIIFIVICYPLILTCNTSSNSSDATMDEQNELKVVAEEAMNNELESDSYKPDLNEHEKDIIPFKTAKWYTNTGNNEMFMGLNSTLMAGVLLNYAKRKHFDPKINNLNTMDSIEVNLKNGTYSLYHKTVSKLSLFDIEYQLLDDRTRIASGDEEISDEELSRREKEKQITLNTFGESNQHLRNIKTYDVHIIKGTFEVMQVKNNNIEIKTQGDLIDIDAFTLHAYGENGPVAENPFSDKTNVNLMEAFNDIGSIQKFTKTDLQIVNLQSLKFLRNQFFARKGYIFKTDAMRDYFSSKAWYTPVHEDVSTLLTAYEKYNAELIKQLEDNIK